MWISDTNDFPIDKNEWYLKRDDRTIRIDGCQGFENFSIGVLIDPRVEDSYDIQVMTITSLNILARWCRKILIQLPTSKSCLPIKNGFEFQEIITKMMSEIDPHGKFEFTELKGNDTDLLLVIGNPKIDSKKPFVWINGFGWIAGFGFGKISPSLSFNDKNPIGPAFASCLGVSELFRQAIGLSPTVSFTKWYSLYDFSSTDNSPTLLKNGQYNPELDFGVMYQIGCGAVGSSLDFLLQLTNWKGKIHLIDFDNVSISNCNRSLSFTAFDTINDMSKVDACSNIFHYNNISSNIFHGSYSDFIAKGNYLNYPPDIILCLANDRNIWTDIQHNYPPVVYHATTTPNWGLNFGRHIPKKEWCILCRFSKEIESNFVPPCSEGVITLEEKNNIMINGVLPFLSPGSAVLILAELLKLSFETYPINNNFIEVSLNTSDGVFIQSQRKPTNGCVCTTQNMEHYPDEITSGKFWRLVKC